MLRLKHTVEVSLSLLLPEYLHNMDLIQTLLNPNIPGLVYVSDIGLH